MIDVRSCYMKSPWEFCFQRYIHTADVAITSMASLSTYEGFALLTTSAIPLAHKQVPFHLIVSSGSMQSGAMLGVVPANFKIAC